MAWMQGRAGHIRASTQDLLSGADETTCQLLLQGLVQASLGGPMVSFSPLIPRILKLTH